MTFIANFWAISYGEIEEGTEISLIIGAVGFSKEWDWSREAGLTVLLICLFFFRFTRPLTWSSTILNGSFFFAGLPFFLFFLLGLP